MGDFDAAVAQAQAFNQPLPDDDAAELYALYQQATEGDNTTPAPDDDNEKKNWDAWTAKKGMDQEAAKAAYIAKVAACCVAT